MLVDITDEQRAQGAVEEMKFWRDFVHTKEFAPFFGPGRNSHLQHDVETFIVGLAAGLGRPARVLDLGSGPVSIFSHTLGKDEAVVSAGDPLAKQYDELLANHPKRGTYVAPVEAEGERLAATFPAHEFDVVHIRNALDHVANPITTLYSMTTVLRPGGYILVHGYENEANTANWGGYHQWNLRLTEAGFVVEGANRKAIVVNEFFRGALTPVRQWMSQMYGRPWLNFIARVN